MKDVKKNLKVISRNMTKQFLIDCTISSAEQAVVKTAIQYIPNPAAQIATRIAGFIGYLAVANYFTKEEKQAMEEALTDMLSGGKTSEEIDTEIDNLMKKMMEDSAKRKSGEEPEGQDA